MSSSRVYCPCIPGVEMSEIRISLTSPLLALHVGWEAGMMNNHMPIMDTLPPYTVSSRKRRKSNSSTEDHESDAEEEHDPDWNLAWPRFIVMSPLDEHEPLSKLSPFAVEKAIKGRFGTVQKVTKMKSGSLLIEATRAKQSRMIRETTNFLNIDVKCTPHRSLNTSKGVIRDHGRDLYDMSEADIVMELREQGVEEVSRFILKKDGKEVKTNTLFVTFRTPTPPEKIKIGYYNVSVNLYIPNPLRCFGCQEFGHSRKFCKKAPKCWKCGREGHEGGECTSDSLCCVNCKGDHYSSSNTCPVWILEKEIQRVKAEKKLTYGEARRLVKESSPSPTPAPSSYANAVRTSIARSTTKTVSVDCQTPAFWIGPQPSLREASRLPSVQTTSTGSGTRDETPSNESGGNINNNTRKSSPTKSSATPRNNENITNKHIVTDKPQTKETPHKITSPSRKQNVKTTNKFLSLQSDVDDEMDDSPPPNRPSRSTSRSRRDQRKISPVHYR